MLAFGNFHEGTAKVYGDLGLLTANKDISREITKVLEIIEKKTRRAQFRHLLVSPSNNRRRIYRLIENEIQFAKEGKRDFY